MDSVKPGSHVGVVKDFALAVAGDEDSVLADLVFGKVFPEAPDGKVRYQASVPVCAVRDDNAEGALGRPVGVAVPRRYRGAVRRNPVEFDGVGCLGGTQHGIVANEFVVPVV